MNKSSNSDSQPGCSMDSINMDERPLSPSAALQQQKLRKHEIKSQPTIEIISTNDPEPDAYLNLNANSRQTAGDRNEIKMNITSSSTQNSLCRINSSPAPQMPINVLKYRNLGKSGLKIPVLGLGVWHNYSTELSETTAESIIKTAFQCGINFFDTGDAFNSGKSESVLGNVIKRNQWNRSDFIVATKLCWNYPINAPNAKQGPTLSRKFLTEALQASLRRLQLQYVDLVIVNRLDGRCPMEEIVRTMHWLVERGLALYWGTSRWSAAHLTEAFSVARQFNCIPPACEQMEYSMGCSRKKCETAMNELYHRLGVGVLSWSVASMECDPGIQLINRKSIAEYHNYGLLGSTEDNQTEVDGTNGTGTDGKNGATVNGSNGNEDLTSSSKNALRTPELSSTENAGSDQRKLSGVSMKLSRKSSQMDKKKMSSVERQLIETANLNVERLNDDRLQVLGDRLQIDRLSVDRLSASSALSTPDKSPSSIRRKPVDRTLSGASVITGGSDRAGSVCGSDLGKNANESDAGADRQARFEALCARLGCDQTQFSIAWSLRQEHVNSVLISPKSIEQLHLFINSIKIIFQLKPSVLEELERIISMKDNRKNSSSVLTTEQTGEYGTTTGAVSPSTINPLGNSSNAPILSNNNDKQQAAAV